MGADDGHKALNYGSQRGYLVVETSKPKVVRGAVATYVIYGGTRDDAYVLRWDDVQRIEEQAGVTLEYVSQADLDAALADLEIGRRVPDPAEWIKLHPEAAAAVKIPPPATPPSVTAARPTAPAATPAPQPRPVAPPPPPPVVNEPAKPSRGPWGIIIPILGGALALLLLLLLVRSCTSGNPTTPGVLTPTVTATLLPTTPPAGEPSVTARTDTPVRSGPGEIYPVVGSLLAGQTVEVVGKSADLQWWAIRFIASPGRVGWLRADQVIAENTDAVPIMQAPAPPTATATPAPTLTATPTVTPSPTPVQAPVAVINGPTAGKAGDRLQFNARRSTVAPGGSLVAYNWDFGDGATAAGVEVTHVYERPGNYDVLLTVTDNNGLQSQAVQRVEISAAPATPTPIPARAGITAPPQANVGQSVTFDGRNSTASAPITQYRWTFGDGGTAEGARVSYIYNAPGVYNVTLVIVDEASREGTANTQIEIIAAATATPQPSPIIGTSWLLASYFDGATGMAPVLPSVTVTALFGANASQLSGSGGCNDYTTTYAASGGVISIAPPAVSGRICTEPAGIAEQEQAFFRMLPLVTGYRLSPGKLELTGPGNNVLLQFAPLVQP